MKMKKMAYSIVILGVLLLAAACGPKDCKAKGCSEKIFEDGYCEEHFYENAFEEGLEKLDDMFDE